MTEQFGGPAGRGPDDVTGDAPLADTPTTPLSGGATPTVAFPAHGPGHPAPSPPSAPTPPAQPGSAGFVSPSVPAPPPVADSPVAVPAYGTPGPVPGQPYAAQPYAAQPYAPPPYAPRPYPGQYPAGPWYPGYQPYAVSPAAPTSASTVVLTVISALCVLSCYGVLIGIGPLIMAIIALTRNSSDPAGARRLTRIGWIVLGSLFAAAVVVIGVVIAIALIPASHSSTV